MDSGNTGDFIQVRAPVINIVRVRKGKRLVVTQPDRSLITSTYTCDLLLPSVFPDVCRQGHIFPSLNSWSLLSIGLFCDHECIALLTSSAIYIYHSNTLVMVGECNLLTKLWLVKLGDKPSQVDTNYRALSLHPLSKPPSLWLQNHHNLLHYPNVLIFIMKLCSLLSSPRSATHLMLDISPHGLNEPPHWCENIHHNLTQ